MACCQEDAVACRSWNTKVMIHFHTPFPTRENHSNIIYSNFYRSIDSWSHQSSLRLRNVAGCRVLGVGDTALGCVTIRFWHNLLAKRDRPVPCGSHQPPEVGDAVSSLARQGLGKISRLCVCGNRARTDWSPAWECPIREPAQAKPELRPFEYHQYVSNGVSSGQI